MSKFNEMLDELREEAETRLINSIRESVLGKKNHGAKEPETPKARILISVLPIMPPDSETHPLILSYTNQEHGPYKGSLALPHIFSDTITEPQAIGCFAVEDKLGLTVNLIADLTPMTPFYFVEKEAGPILHVPFLWRIEHQQIIENVKSETYRLFWDTRSIADTMKLRMPYAQHRLIQEFARGQQK